MRDEQLRLAHERVRIGQASPDEALSLQAPGGANAGTELPALRKQPQQTEHLLAVLAGRARARVASRPSLWPISLYPSNAARRALRTGAPPTGYPGVRGAVACGQCRLWCGCRQALSNQPERQPWFSGADHRCPVRWWLGSVWGLVAQLTQPLFNPGLPAERAALAAFDAAAANYQSVVLESLRNVADTLRAVESDAQTLTALAAADMAAQASFAVGRAAIPAGRGQLPATAHRAATDTVNPDQYGLRSGTTPSR